MDTEALNGLKQPFEVFYQKISEARKQLRAEGEVLLKTAFKQVFEVFPEVTLITWTQYTPWFNDGEPCEFAVHELQVNMQTEAIEALGVKLASTDYDKAFVHDPNSIGYDHLFGGRYHENTLYASFDYKSKEATYATDRAQMLDEALSSIQKVLRSEEFEPIMKETFGDHVQVIVTPGKITIEEYEHD